MSLKTAKQQALTALRRAGFFPLFLNSGWRGRRLLVLCYHGISQRDEHQWNPELYMSLEQFTARMALLQKHRCNVLPLGEALARLRRGSLPERSVSLTFDDGFFNFYSRALPVLRSFGFPATVYLTTYYSGIPAPIFSLACSYILWKGSARDERADPVSARKRATKVEELHRYAVNEKLTTERRDDLVAQAAADGGVNYSEFRNSRILQLMNAPEVSELKQAGIATELHTHRHRTPLDESLFTREIIENRACISRSSGTNPRHFCYPNGRHQPQFLQWLANLNVESATTCKPGLASRAAHPLLLPRLVDTTGLSELEFESWIAGVGALLPRRSQS